MLLSHCQNRVHGEVTLDQHAGAVRVAIIAESFLPHFNGVTNSVLRALEHFAARGHEAVVICPAAARLDELRGKGVPVSAHGFPVHTVPSVPLATYPAVRLATVSTLRLRRLLADIRPDVVHLASPFVLGWKAQCAAEQLGIPTVAMYQTEVPNYANRYKMPWLTQRLWDHVRTVHSSADLTLVPSSFSRDQLAALGVQRLSLLGRGVDTEQFTPTRRDAAFRKAIAPNGERLIGFVGRLAAEKQVEDLRVLNDLENTRLVIVGSGPMEPSLRQALPGAHFTGFLSGTRLASVMASLDVFVHTGESETFCQTIQESMACAVPVVAVGRGGPLDLVDSSRTGWLYQPGALDDLRARVVDLAYDDAKRLAFGQAAQRAVQGRSWESIGDQLLTHYRSVCRSYAAS